MKKRIFSLLVFLFVLIPCVGILGGCKKDEPKVIATYQVASVTMSIDGFYEGSMTRAEYDALMEIPEEDLTADQVEDLEALGYNFDSILKLKDNNTFEMIDSEETTNGSYEKNETSYILTVDNESMTFVIGENSLTLSISEMGTSLVIVYELV